MRFSDRYGYTKAREIIQLNSIDTPLRNAIWNVLKLCVWDRGHPYSEMSDSDNEFIQSISTNIWFDYLKRPLEEIDEEWRFVLKRLRNLYSDFKWYEVYNFVEFIANELKGNTRNTFVTLCNNALESEMSAYRIVGNSVVRITDTQEIEEIDRARESSSNAVKTHLDRALQMLSDRKSPDYRNSIKESISAVESLVSKTVGEKGTLGQLIKKLEGDAKLHPALQAAFSSLYGFTSDGGGIRHALMEAENVGFEEAKFMLVVCSAFVNFVQTKVK